MPLIAMRDVITVDTRCIAIVGAGGKTTFAWRVVQHLNARAQKCIFSATTKVWLPTQDAFDELVVEPSLAPALSKVNPDALSICIGHSLAPSIHNYSRANEVEDSLRFMPVNRQHKLIGYAPDALCEAVTQTRNHIWIVEADGAKNKLIKAPADHEPQLPSCADVVAIVVSLDALHQPLTAAIAHRPELIASVCNLRAADAIHREHLVELVTSSRGGMKNVGADVRKIVVLTHSRAANADDVTWLARAFDARGIDTFVMPLN
jgi:probable selenium-dependent hydroxylase accessory protein YqeC